MASRYINTKFFKNNLRIYENVFEDRGVKYWWIIARYNNKPTDAHYTVGDEVLIPGPFSLIRSFYIG